MKTANVALVSLLTLGLVMVGCAANTASTTPDGTLASTDEQLVSDSDEAQSTDSDLEAGVDDPLSGSSVADPGTPGDAATDALFMDKVRVNAGLFFKPAGCLTTTVSGNVATHVFNDCTGPNGLLHFTGTVTSTYVRAAGSLTITHQAQGFKINGATISGERVVVYTVNGAVITKHRTGDWSGTTGKGNAITHKADFTSTYDTVAKCVTRDGSATTNVAARELDFTITGYKRCGIGNYGCPESGEIVLSRSVGDKTKSVTIDFLGGNQYRVTGPNGGQVTRALICKV